MAAAANGRLPPLTCHRSTRRKPSRSHVPTIFSSGRAAIDAGHLSPLRNPTTGRAPGLLLRSRSGGGRGGLEEASVTTGNRREFLLKPLLAIGGAWLASRSVAEAATEAPAAVSSSNPATGGAAAPAKEDIIVSRVYDATVIGEPLALEKDKSRIWDKLMNARVVYLGEAEHVPVSDDKDLELEIVRNLRNKCFEQERSISLALEAFPCDLQEQLNDYMSKRIDGESLRSYVSHWTPGRWLEYEPLLSYCCDNGVRLVACGTPLEVIAGVIEHRLSNQFLSSAPILVNALSFVARTVNSYWGTQQWIDLARFTWLQTRTKAPSKLPPEVPAHSTVDGEATVAGTMNSSNNQSSVVMVPHCNVHFTS